MSEIYLTLKSENGEYWERDRISNIGSQLGWGWTERYSANGYAYFTAARTEHCTDSFQLENRANQLFIEAMEKIPGFYKIAVSFTEDESTLGEIKGTSYKPIGWDITWDHWSRLRQGDPNFFHRRRHRLTGPAQYALVEGEIAREIKQEEWHLKGQRCGDFDKIVTNKNKSLACGQFMSKHPNELWVVEVLSEYGLDIPKTLQENISAFAWNI